MFSFQLLRGNPTTALNDMHSIILTEKTAKSIFGNEDPMGKTVLLDNKDNFTVSGVMKDLPNNTVFNYEFLLPWSYIKLDKKQDLGWNDNSTRTYVMLKQNASIASANAKIKGLKQKYSDEAGK
ncbi:ABC transporter permease [Mucilaginibacter humi]|uniref:ABC transporter permease n=1 Tax=Mucilaginibacter humi TaxID=2732510 RepID=UPI001FEB6D09|nr:ABC transporter permease [Mucilaginibacter humi]